MKPTFLSDMHELVTLRILRKARALISKPTAWTKGQYSRNRYNGAVYPEHKDAVCFCMAGAVIRATADLEQPAAVGERVLDRLSISIRDKGMSFGITGFNDAPSRTHQEVLDMLDEFINLLTPQERLMNRRNNDDPCRHTFWQNTFVCKR